MWIVGLAVLLIAVVGSTAWAVQLFRIATRDSSDLAAKLRVPHPGRAADWPELRVDEVVFDPEIAERVLVVACWPASPESRVLLTLEVDDVPDRARRLLVQWRDSAASVSPSVSLDEELVLRRRRTNAALRARVVSEMTHFGAPDATHF